MKHIKALLIKFVMVTAVLWIVLGGFYDVSFGDILTTSVLLTVGAYLIGDLFILPKLGNTAATIADFGLVLMGTWVLGAILFEADVPLGTASLISAVLIAVGEMIFHRYMEKSILPNQSSNTKDERNFSHQGNLQTEFGSDVDIKPTAKKPKETDEEE
ncbi:YndM family protein [Halobacillus ihumii]|uniref:YndM family protein n=1 Tax=Halobacillus ihumii TaxID=2686092 RepID=UPI0013D79BF3|nr:YndM family protein [Halobacillus ihumii]